MKPPRFHNDWNHPSSAQLVRNKCGRYMLTAAQHDNTVQWLHFSIVITLAMLCQTASYCFLTFTVLVLTNTSQVVTNCTFMLSTCAVQLKNAPNFTKVKVNAPIYKGSGGIEPSEERSQKQDKAAHSYAEVGSRPHCSLCSVADHVSAECVNCC